MDVPDLVRDSLGGEEIAAGVNLGDEDTVCLTPTRTLLYRADGLLSDEKVEEYPHDVEQLDVSEGRRKTKFILQYIDGTRKFSVPSSRDTQVLELLFQGILRAKGVIEEGESVTGAFRFSELTLVVTEARLIKHIGAVVWTDEFAVYPFADITGLSFEQGSVATEIVLEVDGRPERIKTPSEKARKVRKLIEEAAFAVHGVSSLEELNAKVTQDEGDDGGSGSAGDDDLELGDGIEPLVADEDGGQGSQEMPGGFEPASEAATTDTGPDPTEAAESRTQRRSEEQSTQSARSETTSAAAASDGTRADASAQRSAEPEPEPGPGPSASAADLAAVEDQLAELTTAVEKQQELLQRQQQTIEKLIQELRQGRG